MSVRTYDHRRWIETDAIRSATRAARAVLTVNLAAIQHNAAVLRELSRGADIMAVLKGDAYGLGALQIARALSACGIAAFAVDSVAEALELRAGGVAGTILIIDGDHADNCAAAIGAQLTPGIANRVSFEAYEGAAKAARQRCPAWLVANVGFNRSGYDASSLPAILERAKASRWLEVRGIYAHMSCAHEAGDISSLQVARFDLAVRTARAILGAEIESSLLASHGIVRWADSLATTWVRPGLLLYGEHCFTPGVIDDRVQSVLNRFRGVLTLRGRISQLVELSEPQYVGYGQAFQIPAGRRLATVTLGYGYGYPSTGRGQVAIVGGRRVPLVGAVGMDALQLDVTSVPNLAIADWVTLIGGDGDERIEVAQLAGQSNVSIYALLRQLRCERRYEYSPM